MIASTKILPNNLETSVIIPVKGVFATQGHLLLLLLFALTRKRLVSLFLHHVIVKVSAFRHI